MNTTIRHEQADDIDVITQLTKAAFLEAEHSDHTEAFIVNALRRDHRLTLSLVAVDNGTIMGHIAISPVTVTSGAQNWFGLGPISVWPDHQGRGIGSQLIHAALAELQCLGAEGCVVLGSPGYYSRFDFKANPKLTLPGVPPEYFQARSFAKDVPSGNVAYAEAFNATE